MSKDFNILLPESIANADFDQSWQLVLRRLGKMVVQNREDFISVLEISGGLTVPKDVTDAQLIDLFVENAPYDEDLILGASLAIAHQHQDSYFDGEPKIDNQIAYGTYDALIEGFGGAEIEYQDEELEEPTSNIFGSKVVKAVRNIAANFSQNKKDEAANTMREAATKEREQQLAAKKIAQEKTAKSKKQNTIILVSVSALALGIIGYLALKKHK